MNADAHNQVDSKLPNGTGAIVRVLDRSELPVRCPFTLEAMTAGEQVAECDACHTPHRLAAWRENEGCSTHSCPRAPNARRDHPDRVLRVGPLARAPIAPHWPTDRIVIRFDDASTDQPPVAPVRPVPPASRVVPPPPAVTQTAPPMRTPPPPPAMRAPSAPEFSRDHQQRTMPPSPPPPPSVPSSARPFAKPGIRRTARDAESSRRCPYSMERLAPGTPVVECHSCGQILTATAWDENGGCATYGCAGAPDFRKDQL